MEPRPFFLLLYPQRLSDARRRIPPHKWVLEPLVSQAAEVVVHQKATYDFEVEIPPHSVRRSTLVLDPSSNLVSDWPEFWNSGLWKRGAVSIKIAMSRIHWHELFAATEYGGVWASRHQILKGSPSGAVNYADKNAQGDFAVFSLSASNGIQWPNVWLPSEMSSTIDEQAREHCGNFVRAVEQGKFSREIVYDRPPYAEAI